MTRAFRRALRLIASPSAEWRAIRDENAAPRSVLLLFLLPLAAIPAVSWSVGLLLFGGVVGTGRDRVALGIAQVMHGGLVVYFCSILSVLMLAASVFALAPLFGCRRDWPRALGVAAYSSAPVLLGGIVLVVPDFAFALLLALLHSFYLLYVGLGCVVGVRESHAAEYVALGVVLFSVASTALGALGAALGLL